MQRRQVAERLSGVTVAPDDRDSQDHGRSPGATLLVEQLHATHGQQLFGFVRRLGLEDEEAIDVTQEALFRLWRAASDGPLLDRPVAWTYRTAYRLAMDRHRVRRRWLAFLGRQTAKPAESIDTRDALLAVWSEVDRLPDRQRQVVYLRYRADLTFEDIGAVLGIDASSARSNGSRAIATLRDRFVEEDVT